MMGARKLISLLNLLGRVTGNKGCALFNLKVHFVGVDE